MLKEIQLAELAPSPSNPRKTFDQVKLQELARSIGEVGVLEPILVRAANGSGRFEVVAGERRFRAATLANVLTVPCILKELTDVQVLEIQTIENLQRDDLHPLEEADGFARLMTDAGYDVEEIAQKISKSGKYVYDRIKLRQLVPELRTVFLDGEISAGHAILLARLSPTDQERILGEGEPGNRWKVDGLFQMEEGHHDPDLDLDDKRARKAISVRELEALIDRTVRFKPDEVDLPNLFPETAATLAAAAEEELKVVKITFEYRVPDEARDEKERTLGRPSWKRADGGLDAELFGKPKPSKECEHSVMGIVVAGRGRGDAFKVCVAKKKCRVHWAAEIKQAEQREKGGGAAPAAAPRAQRNYDEERRIREVEDARWGKAVPKLLEAVAEKLGAMPTTKLLDIVITELLSGGQSPKGMTRGKTLEDGLRFAAFLVLSSEVDNNLWDAAKSLPKVLKPLGIDAKKIVDQVAPKEKPKKEAAPKAEKKTDQRKAAGARAAARSRAAKKKVQTSAKAAARG